MQVIYQHEIENISPCVATVGFFDGVHAGHRFLIEKLKTIARAQNQKSVVLTFSVHPRTVLNTDYQPELLTTLSEKLIQLEYIGIDICLVLDFSTSMAQLTAYEFLKTVLLEQFNVHTLLVGHDHRFGHNRSDGFPEYQHYGEAMGMKVIQAQRFTTDEDNHISSSEIRNALQIGGIEHANRLLTYQYRISGKVIDGFKVGRKIGFPTANISLGNSNKLIPGLGVYAVRVIWDNKMYIGMLNIGYRPTLNGTKVSIEVHIIDFDEDIYNQIIEVVFIRKIRDEHKFNDVNELITQLQKDKQNVMGMD